MTQITIAEWLATVQDRPSNDTVWGRIVPINDYYIVTGYNTQGYWVRIPCAQLTTAKLYIGHTMSQRCFDRHSNRQKHFARLEQERFGWPLCPAPAETIDHRLLQADK